LDEIGSPHMAGENIQTITQPVTAMRDEGNEGLARKVMRGEEGIARRYEQAWWTWESPSGLAADASEHHLGCRLAMLLRDLEQHRVIESAFLPSSVGSDAADG